MKREPSAIEREGGATGADKGSGVKGAEVGGNAPFWQENGKESFLDTLSPSGDERARGRRGNPLSIKTRQHENRDIASV